MRWRRAPEQHSKRSTRHEVACWYQPRARLLGLEYAQDASDLVEIPPEIALPLQGLWEDHLEATKSSTLPEEVERPERFVEGSVRTISVNAYERNENARWARFARIQEAVYFKILGAKSRFVLKVFAMENLFLGLVSALLALFLSQVGSWIVSVQVFAIDYKPFIGPSLIMIVVAMLLVTAVGLLASLSILRKRPIIFLREQNEG